MSQLFEETVGPKNPAGVVHLFQVDTEDHSKFSDELKISNAVPIIPSLWFKDFDGNDIEFEQYKKVPFTKAEFYDDGRAHLVMDTRLLQLSDADEPGVRTPYLPYINKHITGHDGCRNDIRNKITKPSCYGYFYVVYTYDLRLSDDRKVIQEYKYNICIPDYIDENGKKHKCFSIHDSDIYLNYPYTKNQSQKCIDGEQGRPFTTDEIKDCYIDKDWLAVKEIWLINDKESKKLANGVLEPYF